MEEISNANPKYQNPNKHFQELVELLNTYGEGGPYWHAAYLDNCDSYGKDYEKIQRCYYAYGTCEQYLPKIIENEKEHPDLFSKNPGKKYKECIELFVPQSWKKTLWRSIGKTLFGANGA